MQSMKRKAREYLTFQGKMPDRFVKELNATKYISGPSGKDYLETKYFEGIDIKFFEPKVPDIYTTLSHI